MAAHYLGQRPSKKAFYSISLPLGHSLLNYFIFRSGNFKALQERDKVQLPNTEENRLKIGTQYPPEFIQVIK